MAGLQSFNKSNAEQDKAAREAKTAQLQQMGVAAGKARDLHGPARLLGLAKVYPYAAVTKGLEGRELAEMGMLAEAGAVADNSAHVWKRTHPQTSRPVTLRLAFTSAGAACVGQP